MSPITLYLGKCEENKLFSAQVLRITELDRNSCCHTDFNGLKCVHHYNFFGSEPKTLTVITFD